MAYTTKSVASQGSLDYRVFFQRDGTFISPFHDIPLWADKANALAHMVVEIPRGQNAKLEICKDEPLNPIKQDVKNGKLRYVHDKYPFNYGALPQTWENPTLKHPDTDAMGDNDPIDACDVSSIQHQTGDVIVVKIIGTYAMIDEGETDWKIICIDVRDPLAEKINDVDDLEKFMPGKAQEVFTFLRDYKIPDGKPPNKFAFNGELKNRDFAVRIIEETYQEWHQIVTNKLPNQTSRYTISAANTSLEDSPYTISKDDAEKAVVESFTRYIRAKN